MLSLCHSLRISKGGFCILQEPDSGGGGAYMSHICPPGSQHCPASCTNLGQRFLHVILRQSYTVQLEADWHSQTFLLLAETGTESRQGVQESGRKQDEDTRHKQQELTNLQQQVEDQAAQLRKVIAEAASQQASSNYLIKHLQSQLQTSQAERDACIQGTKSPVEDTGWTVQQATASVARVLRAMSESQGR